MIVVALMFVSESWNKLPEFPQFSHVIFMSIFTNPNQVKYHTMKLAA